MPSALRQEGFKNYSSGSFTQFPDNPTDAEIGLAALLEGSVLHIATSTSNSDQPDSVTVNGNPATKVNPAAVGNHGFTHWWYVVTAADAAIGVPEIYANWSTTHSYPGIYVREITGIDIASPVQGSDTSYPSIASGTAGGGSPIATTAPAFMSVICQAGSVFHVGPTADTGAGFTQGIQVDGANNAGYACRFAAVSEHQRYTADGDYTGTVFSNNTDSLNIGAVVFNEAAPGGQSGSISESGSAGASFGATARTSAGLSAAGNASDAQGSGAAAGASLAAAASGNVLVEAIAAALGALAAGAAAGESWALSVHGLAQLVAAGVAAETISATSSGVSQEALAASSPAAESFQAAATTVAALTPTASAGDAIAAIAAAVGDLHAAGAAAGSFAGLAHSGAARQLAASGAGVALWATVAAVAAALDEAISAQFDLSQVTASVSAALNAAGSATAGFAAGSGGSYLVARSIAIVAALNGSVSVGPALGGSVSLKPA